MTSSSTRSGAARLTVDGLGKTYGEGAHAKEVLKGLQLTVEPGELVTIVGPSGAGKTTLLKCLTGLLPATAGRVSYGDRPVDRPQPELAVVFQDYRGSLMPWMRVRENVAFPLKARGVRKSERRARAERALGAVGLDDVSDRHPWQLSGGMQQRVAIARALAYESPVLVMDEPFGSLDAQTRFDLEDLLQELRRTLDITIVLVTHDIDEAIYLGDRVVVLSGSPATVVDTVAVPLAYPRDQVSTKGDPEFGALRGRILNQIRGRRVGLSSTV